MLFVPLFLTVHVRDLWRCSRVRIQDLKVTLVVPRTCSDGIAMTTTPRYLAVERYTFRSWIVEVQQREDDWVFAT